MPRFTPTLAKAWVDSLSQEKKDNMANSVLGVLETLDHYLRAPHLMPGPPEAMHKTYPVEALRPRGDIWDEVR